jgi:hypothetical protein
MLRLFVLLLVLINSLYFSWTQGLLAGLGLAPEQQTEPQHLHQQIRPEELRLLSAAELQLVDAPAPAASAPECLQAGPFTEAQGALLRGALAATMPPGSWTLDTVKGQGMMLRLTHADGAQRTRLEELKPALAGQTLNPCP